jgi:large subunit ribosomal protein L11
MEEHKTSQGKFYRLITVYEDKSFEFVIKTPPAAIQLMEAAKVKGGSGEPNRVKVGSVTWEQVKKSLKIKWLI